MKKEDQGVSVGHVLLSYLWAMCEACTLSTIPKITARAMERVWLPAERRNVTLPEASCSAAPLLPPGGRPDLIHLITFSTRQTQLLQGCWLQWVSHVLAADATPTRHYRIHLRTFDATNNLTADGLSRRSQLATARTAAGSFQTAAWYNALRAKMVLIKDVMDEQKDAAGENDVFVVTDLDVAPLRPYSNLLACLEYDITFMRCDLQPCATLQPPVPIYSPVLREHSVARDARDARGACAAHGREPPGHSGSFGSHVVNGGFYVIRNTPSVRAFLVNVVAKGKMFPKLHDQDIANAILLSKIRHPRANDFGLPDPRNKPHLNWGVFPSALVTGRLEEVNERTVAYHAIGAENTTHKATRLSDAFQRSGTSLPHCRLRPSSANGRRWGSGRQGVTRGRVGLSV